MTIERPVSHYLSRTLQLALGALLVIAFAYPPSASAQGRRPPRGGKTKATKAKTPPTGEAAEKEKRSSNKCPRTGFPQPRVNKRPGLNRIDPKEAAFIIVHAPSKRSKVTIDDKPYPMRNARGVMVTAGEYHEIKVIDTDSSMVKCYHLKLAPGEARVLMVDLAAGQAKSSGPRKPGRSSNKGNKQDSETEGKGFLTVNARPEAQVYVDGKLVSKSTPMTRQELDVGSHTVRVFYISEREFSETRRAVVTEGRHISLFFQHRPKK